MRHSSDCSAPPALRRNLCPEHGLFAQSRPDPSLMTMKLRQTVDLQSGGRRLDVGCLHKMPRLSTKINGKKNDRHTERNKAV